MLFRNGNFILELEADTLTANRVVRLPDDNVTIGGNTLDSLVDTIITNPSDDDVVRHNGTNFVNAPQILGFADLWDRLFVFPGDGATTALGTTIGTVGTVTTPARATTSIQTEAERVLITSAAAAGSLASCKVCATNNKIWRGNGAGKGGFRIQIPFGLGTIQAGNRGFIGLDSASANPTNVDPLTSTTSAKFGVGFNTNTGNLRLIYNVAGTAPTTADLGANFPLNTTNWYKLFLWANPNASSIGYRVTNTGTGATTSATISTNLPANTAFLSPLLWMTNNATAASVALAFGAIKCEFG